jgi:hypothetical protein
LIPDYRGYGDDSNRLRSDDGSLGGLHSHYVANLSREYSQVSRGTKRVNLAPLTTTKYSSHGMITLFLGAVWFLSIWPNTQEYRYTRRYSAFGFRPGEYSNTGIKILSI